MAFRFVKKKNQPLKGYTVINHPATQSIVHGTLLYGLSARKLPSLFASANETTATENLVIANPTAISFHTLDGLVDEIYAHGHCERRVCF
mmetsp:Transcript_16588/g.39817  ORF Transcript_16588/g.39817 Transcript_16588/m.39817 type:complete len:90 (-) Transcript_16588:76-345(-)